MRPRIRAEARMMVLKKRNVEDGLWKGSSRKANGEVDASSAGAALGSWRWEDAIFMLRHFRVIILDVVFVTTGD
jgi:hypothetical protein